MRFTASSLFFFVATRMQTVHVEFNVTRSATCPCLQASPVKYRPNPRSIASCLLMISCATPTPCRSYSTEGKCDIYGCQGDCDGMSLDAKFL